MSPLGPAEGRRPRESPRGSRRAIGTLVMLLGVLLCLSVGWPLLRDAARRADLAEPEPVSLSAPVRPSDSVSVESPAVLAPTPADAASTPGVATGAAVRAGLPDHVFIPSIGVNTTVSGKPAAVVRDPVSGADVTAFGVPDDGLTVTWWSDGPVPGDPGLSILLGHSGIGSPAVFDRLPQLVEGAAVGVRRGDRLARFEVERVVTGIPKADPAALRRVLEDPPSGAGLALITCSGQVRSEVPSHADNTVVFARLVGVE